MVVKMEQIAPILPVRDVPMALAHYQQLGLEVRAYGASGEANPEYGFARFSASRSSPSLTFASAWQSSSTLAARLRRHGQRSEDPQWAPKLDDGVLVSMRR
jgi:hypothetical protein